VWLDSPLIDMIQGEGYVKKKFPAMYRQYINYDINIAKLPMLIYPTLHYQNGGVEIDADCKTNVPGLFVAGEVSGGVHGRNRLMGNSVLDYNVFGRRAGRATAEYVQTARLGTLTLDHVNRHEQELKDAGIETDQISPVILPSYTPESVAKRQLTAHLEGTMR
jgi:succinate dehydrogenase/fumarate reductase flavoprotein subunit